MTTKTKVAVAVVAMALVGVLAYAWQRSRAPEYSYAVDTLGQGDTLLSPGQDMLADQGGSEGGSVYYTPETPRRTVSRPREVTTRRSPSSGSWIVVPAGTAITVSLRTRLSTKTSDVGDPFTARVTRSVSVGGRQVIPSGATVRGHVQHVRQPGKSSGRGELRLYYDSVAFGGRSYALATRSVTYESKGGGGKDAKIIGGGAAAGAVIGGILGGSAGSAAKGAVIGAAGGTAASLMTRGPQLTFEPGTVLSFRLDNPVRVRRASA